MADVQSQNYQLIEKVVIDGDIPCSLYVNTITGLKVVVAHTECPIIKGDLTVATEALDDDGLPHTLEHLVFLGSDSYPFKGVLDLLASRCFSSGTNAHTDTDHTNYSLATAGSEGFLTLLPVYLDHVLFPTLTDAGYLTEVHHINGEGEDAGVVYCEMQARQNTGDSRCYLEMIRYLYPGICGYKSETGGLIENLRSSTDNIKVRDYHKQFYHTNNLCITVTGPVEPEEIFKAIKPIEDKVVQRGGHKMVFERPWQTPVQPLAESVRRTIQYPSDTDEDGLVYIAFRGPLVVNDYVGLIAISILMDYLNSTAISPIQREFVESAEPYCASVSHSLVENSTSFIYLTFESVGRDYLDLVTDKLFSLLKNIRQGVEKFDMERLHTIISRKIVRILSIAETSPHTMVIGPSIGHFLYGNDNFQERCNEIAILKRFVKEDAQFWLDLMDRYMIGEGARYVSIVGDPSPTHMNETSEAEKKRIEMQKEKLKDELPAIAETLQKAIDANETPAPPSLYDSYPVPSIEKIKYHTIDRVVLDEDTVPFRLQYDSIKTNFVNIHLLMNTSGLRRADRLYLPLLSELLFECAIQRGDKIVPYQQIVAELFSDTVSYSASIGLASNLAFGCGSFSMLFDVEMQVEIEKYEKAVNWFREILYQTKFDQDRIKTIATRLTSEISQYKRSGGEVTSAAVNGLAYQSNSNYWASNFMRQRNFLKKTLKDLSKQPDMVVQEITRILDTMTNPGNILVHITLNKNKIDVSMIQEPWKNILPSRLVKEKNHIKLTDIIPCHKLLQPLEAPKSAIVGVGSVESNYMQIILRSLYDPMHPDIAAVYVLLQYLTQLEGPLWRQIRGLGLSYHYSVQISPSSGVISFLLYKSTQLLAAYNKTIEIMNRFLANEEFDDNLFVSAKSSLIFKLIKSEKSAAGKSQQSLVAHLRNLSINYNKDLIARVATVTKEDLRRVGPIYVKPLFEDDDRRSAICCHPSKLKEISESFKNLGYSFEKINLEEAEFLSEIE